MHTANKYSIAKIAWFPDKLRSLLTQAVTAPIYVRIKPTNRCPHKCSFCVYRSEISGMHESCNQTDTLSKEKLLEILDDLKQMGVKAVTYSGGGEPLAHPAIEAILERTLSNGLDLSMLTNGQLLRGRPAELLGKGKWVRVSIDYANADQFCTSRGLSHVHYRQLLDNFKSFRQLCSCEFTANFIVHRGNYTSLVDAAALLKSHGFDNVRFSPVWMPDFQEYHKSIAETVYSQLEQVRQLADAQFTVNTTYDLSLSAHTEVRDYSVCYFCQIVPVIAADGNVYTCHNKAYDPAGRIGSILHSRFKDLWFSEEARQFFSSFNPSLQCNHQCANDTKNKFIADVLASYGDNFV